MILLSALVTVYRELSFLLYPPFAASRASYFFVICTSNRAELLQCYNDGVALVAAAE